VSVESLAMWERTYIESGPGKKGDTLEAR